MKYVFIALSLCLTMSSCGIFEGSVQQQENANELLKKTMDSWMDTHKSDLIKAWGPPTRYESDGKGGEILIYEKQVTLGSVIGNNYYQRTVQPYKMLYANASGIIYYWRTGTN